MTIYLDYNATTPVLPEVADLVYKMMVDEFGNAGSRTHEFGVAAKRAVELARGQVANVVGAEKSEVIFTSGATESNNIAILGLREFAEANNKKHIITTKIEHKSVLEPIKHLQKQGFDVTYLNVGESGDIDVNELKAALRDETCLVSIMHINNETGSIQPIGDVCQALASHEAYLHVDAAQSFGKYPSDIDNPRIDLVSVSGHKLYAPKGIGTLILRRRDFTKPPLTPIYLGGGQEKGLRPGTLAVPLIAGFGLACELAQKNAQKWCEHAAFLKANLMDSLKALNAEFLCNPTSPYVLNFSVPGVNSEALMVQLKGIAAVSNGSACTSNSYTPSHVLSAMGLNEEKIAGSIRISWSHLTKTVPSDEICRSIKELL
ncbi:cysteine desulfurase DndA [Methylomonas methanica]|uniref:cysteine desulfurase n=1 Tax=Methylomonas methanica TaxID=421 RepID=A0A177MKN9_METMH|nr:cysteine desulfurase DndA [Methylomonas methanica]OAI06191.1 cysteine desulfurase DndA [Methylomonas methanica]